MAKRTYISGLDEVIQNLNKRVGQIEGVTSKGLLRAGHKIQGESQRMCPVVTGNLKGSAYTKMLPGGHIPTVEIGFTAEYAPKVHENPRAGKTGKPGASEVGQWKFLEEAVKQNEDKILDIIRSEAKKT